MRDNTEYETGVLNHTTESASEWVKNGRYGTVNSHIELAERRINEAIIIAARVKQMDPTGFLEACGARAMGLTLTGCPEPSHVAGVSAAVAYLLNHLEPAEASSLASGTDITDNAITRVKNNATLAGATTHLGHLDDKVKEWEESYDYAMWKYKDRYKPLAERMTGIGRDANPRDSAEKVVNGYNVRNKVQSLADAKAIFGQSAPKQ
tara:strand:+ start:596 stop:1216 length:621 start_codon:yes stop_codon:yes gene_type:complete